MKKRILFILFQRKDLIIESIATAIIVTLLALFVYAITNLLTPGWIDNFLLFRNIPRFIFINMALDDLVWFFLAGAFVGPLYEYWQEGRLIKAK